MGDRGCSACGRPRAERLRRPARTPGGRQRVDLTGPPGRKTLAQRGSPRARRQHAVLGPRPIRRSMGRFDPPPAARNLVVFESRIEPLPEIGVADLDALSEVLPGPLLFAPASQPALDAFADVAAWRKKRYAGRPVQGFEGPHDGQQFKAVARDARLGVVNSPVDSSRTSDRKAPSSATAPRLRCGEYDKLGDRFDHAQYPRQLLALQGIDRLDPDGPV